MRLLSTAKRWSWVAAVLSVGCSSSSTPATDGGVLSDGELSNDSGKSDSSVDSSTGDGATDGRAGEGGTNQPTLLKGSIYGFSAVPPTGPAESNPYGVAIVPAGFPKSGTLQPGDILVANFNDASNAQGAGTTIVRITPSGDRSTFFTSSAPGLTEALAVLSSGFVLVGNVPAAGDDAGTAEIDGGGSIGAGSLQVLDANGTLQKTLADAKLLADPWGIAVNDKGTSPQIFVSNAITGTVTRLDASVSGTTLNVNSMTQIASGYATRPDTSAFVVGPGGMVYDASSDTLYVTSEAEKVGGVEAGTVFSVAKAGATKSDGGKGKIVYADKAHLRGPVGLVRAPDGNLIAANTDAVNSDSKEPSELVEFTTDGKFVNEVSVDPETGGAFAVATGVVSGQAVFAAVDDVQTMLTVWETGQPFHPVLEVSTLPPKGAPQSNPYGVAITPEGFPTGSKLQAGDVLVANFNGATGIQGTGSTVLRITPTGSVSTFFTSSALGLTEALTVLKSGLVLVGNVPNSPGLSFDAGLPPDAGLALDATLPVDAAVLDGGLLPDVEEPEAGESEAGISIGAGALQVLDADGTLLQTITDETLLAEPWGIAVNDEGSTAQIFVSSVITGTVTRLDASISGRTLKVTDKVKIASGYATRIDSSAFVVGPAGMVYDASSDTLYVASEAEKVGGVASGTIYAIAKAGKTKTDGGKGTVVYADASHLRGPVGLVLAPDGNLIAANTDSVNSDSKHPSELVEFTTAGTFVNEVSVDPGTGAAFALAIGASGGNTVLAVLSDNQNAVSLRTVP